MAGCRHKNCGSIEKVWLPYTYRGMEIGLKPHPYCVECGTVKNLSGERPRSSGYYMNIVAALGKEFKIAQIQIRLLVQEMEKVQFEDAYGMDRHQQEKLFVEMAKKFLNVPERAVAQLF